MTDQQHPITPPPELILQWLEDGPEDGEFGISKHIATQAARWGADQELEACVKWASCFNYDDYRYGEVLRDIRRPKSPSLKEQALAELNLTTDSDGAELSQTQVELIRRALESLPS
jgi:hypothetical protein